MKSLVTFTELITERFLLQQIMPDDQRFIFEGLSHPVVTTFYGVKYDTFESAKRQMEWYERNYREGTGHPWKIVDKVSGEKIGVVAYYYFKPEHKKAEVGFWIFPQYWNKGITTEVLKEVIRYCQEEKNIHRLEAFVEEGNAASSRVLEKIGFVYEGTMKECEIKDEKFISLLMYALVRAN
jgi:ribosomal-protein-alanine N-acetyltransferase